MKTKIILHENRVKIYFKDGKHFIRFNTGVPAFSKSEFYRSDPEKLFNIDAPLYHEYNKKIKDAQALVEQIVNDNLGKMGVVLNNEYIRTRISSTHNEKSFTKKYLIEYYLDFLSYKREYYQENNASVLSNKDYTSLKQSLIDYHLVKNELYQVDDLCFTWVKAFLSFLTERHKKFVNKKDVDEKILSLLKKVLKTESERKYKLRFMNDKVKLLTRGELCDNSTQKRFDNLNEFIKYLYKKKIISWYPEELTDLRKLYKSYKPDFITLTVPETKELFEYKIDFDYDDKRYDYVRDIMYFMCLTSFRFRDVLLFDRKTNIDGDTIKLYPHKTDKHNLKSVVPITINLKYILEKHDYKLSRYDNTLFNRYLSEFLEKSGLFRSEFRRRKKMKCETINLPVIQKYQALSAHSGRRSCITNLINNDYSLARIKTVSGHSNEKMVERYYDAFRENSIDNRDLIRSLDFNENKKSS